MSETTATALKFAAGIILAIVLVSIGIMVFQPAADSAKSVTTDFASNTTELKDQKYLIYDNTVVSGSQVVNAIRKFKTQAADGELGISVITGKSKPTAKWYYATYGSDKVTVNPDDPNLFINANDSTHVDYINPAGMFKATIQRDSNGVIRSIDFVQQETK